MAHTNCCVSRINIVLLDQSVSCNSRAPREGERSAALALFEKRLPERHRSGDRAVRAVPAPDSTACPSPFTCHSFTPAPDDEHSQYHACAGRGPPRADLGARSSVMVRIGCRGAARGCERHASPDSLVLSGTRLMVDFHEQAAMGTPTARGCCEEPRYSHGATVPQTSVGHSDDARAPSIRQQRKSTDAHSAVGVTCHGTHPVSIESMAAWDLTAARAW
jgi:hypothetical protein